MLDFSWSHILIVLIVALVVVGPKDLPRLMRILGQWTGKARAMANEFRKSFDDMARQAEVEELRAEINALRDQKLGANSIMPPAEPPQPIEPGAEPPP